MEMKTKETSSTMNSLPANGGRLESGDELPVKRQPSLSSSSGAASDEVEAIMMNAEDSMSPPPSSEEALPARSVDRVKRKAKRLYQGKPPLNGHVVDMEDPILNGSAVNGISVKDRTAAANGDRRGKNRRKPRGRYGRGLAKKGGAGGKGTWGKPGSELLDVDEGVDDPYDPNYDSDSQDICKFEAITPPLNEDEIEKHLAPIITEYFEHGDTSEVLVSLDDLNLGENEHQLLIMAVTFGMDRKASARELISVLISDLYGRVLREPDIERGFNVLLKSLPDLVLDTPTAAEVLGNFIARAVADDCIPPKYVNVTNDRVAKEEDAKHAKEAMEHATALLNMKHGLVRLDSVWGTTGGMRPVKYLIRQIQLLLREYISSGDSVEASRCLKDLEVPHFHHEFVFEAVVMVLEDMGQRTLDLMVALLQHLCVSALVTVDQLANGMRRVYEEMPEIAIDVPMAYIVLDKFVSKCDADGFMPKDIVKTLPVRGRKRFVSEGDGGLLKEEA